MQNLFFLLWCGGCKWYVFLLLLLQILFLQYLFSIYYCFSFIFRYCFSLWFFFCIIAFLVKCFFWRQVSYSFFLARQVRLFSPTINEFHLQEKCVFCNFSTIIALVIFSPKTWSKEKNKTNHTLISFYVIVVLTLSLRLHSENMWTSSW